MFFRSLALASGFLVMGAYPQATKPPAAPKDIVPLHTVEPVVIRDGSVKIDVYARLTAGSRVEPGDVIVTGAGRDNQASFNVPVAVTPLVPGKSGPARVSTATARAHKVTAVDRYVYEIEKLEGRKFVPYALLEFRRVDLSWRISPKGPGPLKLVNIGKPVTLTGDWAEHTETTYEYGFEKLRLRVASVTIIGPEIGSKKINLATGCSVFRVEPATHRPHPMPFDHRPCGKTTFDPQKKYATVEVTGLETVRAVDLSYARLPAAALQE
jgi:hypothetical protein